MSTPAGYRVAPQYLIEVGEALRATLYIHMATNQTVVPFLKKGEDLEMGEFLKLKQIGLNRILIRETDYQEVIQAIAIEMAGTPPPPPKGAPAPSVPKGPATPPPMMKKIASRAMSSMGVAAATENPAQVAARIRQTLDETSKLLSDVMSRAQTVDQSAIEKYLSGLGQDRSPIATHNRYVGALSGLMLLTFKQPQPQELADLVLAGMLHDVCLDQIPPLFLEQHLSAFDLGLECYRAFSQDAMILNYRQHVDRALDKIKELEVAISPGVRRHIDEHHENLDGSGLYGLKADKIHPNSKILRIADDVIALVQNPKAPCSLFDAAERLKGMNDNAGGVYYDSRILELLIAALRKA